MTLAHLFIAWVCITLYLCVIFVYEMWRHRRGDYDVPKAATRAEERPKAVAPRSETMKAPATAPDPPRSSPPVRQNPVVERHNELIDWLMDHKKRDLA